MTIEEIRKNAPEGSTHYDVLTDDSYRIDEDSIYYWWRGFWHFFCSVNRIKDLDMDLKPFEGFFIVC